MDERVLQEFCEITRDSENSQIIKKVVIKHTPKPCEDCGDWVKNRIVNTRRCSSPIIHWRKQCAYCKKFQNPDTGEYSMNTSNEVTNYLLSKHRKHK